MGRTAYGALKKGGQGNHLEMTLRRLIHFLWCKRNQTAQEIHTIICADDEVSVTVRHIQRLG